MIYSRKARIPSSLNRRLLRALPERLILSLRRFRPLAIFLGLILFAVVACFGPDEIDSDAPYTQRRVRPRLADQAAWFPCPVDAESIMRCATRKASQESPLHSLGLNPDPNQTVAIPGSHSTRGSGLWNRAPQDEAPAKAWIDYSARLLITAESQHRPSLFLKAIDATRWALEKAPTSSAALYNRALTLEAIGARRQALSAWGRYLSHETDPEWIEEVEDRLREDLVVGLTGSRYPLGLEASAAVFPTRPEPDWRSLHEEGLRRLIDTKTSESVVPSLAERAEALAAWSSDSLLQRVFEPAMSCERRACDVAVQGVELYLEARSHLDRHEGEQARELLSKAATLLADAQNPLEHWAHYYLAQASYRLGQREKAREQASDVFENARAESYWNLAGWSGRFLGLVETELGRPEQALFYLEHAAEAFRRTRQLEMEAAVYSNMAAPYGDLGDPEQEWRYRLAALRLMSRIKNERWPVLFGVAALSASRAGAYEAAKTLLAETFDLDVSSGIPLNVAEAYWWRASIHHRGGEVRKALSDARTARRHAADITNAATRRNTLAGLLELEGESLMSQDPAAAFEVFGQALALVDDLRLEYRLGRLHVLRGRAARNLGEESLEIESLAEALEEFESKRSDIVSREHRIGFFDRARIAFEDRIELSLRQGRPEEALGWADLSKARELQSILIAEASGLPTEPRQRSDWILGGLPAGTGIVLFEVLESTTIAWWADSTGVTVFDLETKRSALERMTAHWVGALREDEVGDQHDREIYETLMAPWLPRAGDIQRIILIPDEKLGLLPFHAIRNPDRGKFLIEDFELVVSPSAGLTTAVWTGGAPWSTPKSLLALAAGQRVELESLPALEYAGEEVDLVSGSYERRSILKDRDADRTGLLSALPHHGAIHFAGHAQAATAGSPGRIHLAGEALSLLEVQDLDMSHVRLVVLSACETHRDRDAGLEGPVTLATAFLAAGARITLATLWPIEDQEAPVFMAQFHRQITLGNRPSKAFQNTVRLLIQSGELSRSAWAPYQLIGHPAR